MEENVTEKEIVLNASTVNIDHLLDCVLHKNTDRYAAVKTIAKGGMGQVSAVKDRSLSRLVAMKTMSDKEEHEKYDVLAFINEARINAMLDHPNVVPIHDLGLTDDHQPFYTMKLVDGVPLSTVISELKNDNPDYVNRYNLSALIQIFLKICDAISFAHSKDIIHLDIKPENIQIGNYGEVLVMDWGISRKMGSKELIRPHSTQLAKSSHATKNTYFSEYSVIPTVNIGRLMDEMETDEYIIGTPGYMAPEQVTDTPETFDERADIYALGSTLYTLITNEQPFVGKTIDAVLELKMNHDLTPPKKLKKDMPDELNSIVLKAMSIDPQMRYRTVEQFSRDIITFQEKCSISVQKKSLLKRIVNSFSKK